ncbi:MAG: diacylglycerol/lipid kinase family protein [Ignavibacteriales bacterium]
MKRVFIVNPVAGKGYALKIGEIIKNICNEQRIDYKIHYTSKPKEATELTKLYAYGLEKTIIYSVGGDGTLCEVVNGIVNSNAMLGIVGAGSGNDFIKAVPILEEGIHSVDVGRVNNQYFINIASIGIDAEVADNISLMKEKGVPRSWLYNASILYTLSKFKSQTVTYNIGESFTKNITLMAICNGRYYGGGFGIAPNALIDDGQFDIYLVDAMPKIYIPGLILKLKNQTHESSPRVHKYTSDHISIDSEEKIVCNVDGEIIKDKHFDFGIQKNGVILYNVDDLKIKKLLRR